MILSELSIIAWLIAITVIISYMLVKQEQIFEGLKKLKE